MPARYPLYGGLGTIGIALRSMVSGGAFARLQKSDVRLHVSAVTESAKEMIYERRVRRTCAQQHPRFLVRSRLELGSYYQRFAFLGNPGRCIRTTQNR
jgi:hypothetical protein